MKMITNNNPESGDKVWLSMFSILTAGRRVSPAATTYQRFTTRDIVPPKPIEDDLLSYPRQRFAQIQIFVQERCGSAAVTRTRLLVPLWDKKLLPVPSPSVRGGATAILRGSFIRFSRYQISFRQLRHFFYLLGELHECR